MLETSIASKNSNIPRILVEKNNPSTFLQNCLKDYIKEQQQKHPSLTLDDIAKKLDISSRGNISAIRSGKRPLSIDQGVKILRNIYVSDKDIEWYINERRKVENPEQIRFENEVSFKRGVEILSSEAKQILTRNIDTYKAFIYLINKTQGVDSSHIKNFYGQKVLDGLMKLVELNYLKLELKKLYCTESSYKLIDPITSLKIINLFIEEEQQLKIQNQSRASYDFFCGELSVNDIKEARKMAEAQHRDMNQFLAKKAEGRTKEKSQKSGCLVFSGSLFSIYTNLSILILCLIFIDFPIALASGSGGGSGPDIPDPTDSPRFRSISISSTLDIPMKPTIKKKTITSFPIKKTTNPITTSKILSGIFRFLR